MPLLAVLRLRCDSGALAREFRGGLPRQPRSMHPPLARDARSGAPQKRVFIC